MSVAARLPAASVGDSVWNPRFLCYCAATGEPDPDRTLARDKSLFPGGSMTGFLVWIGEMWSDWDDQRPAQFARDEGVRTPAEHEVFTAWLRAKVGV